jgi:hypothetical protein
MLHSPFTHCASFMTRNKVYCLFGYPTLVQKDGSLLQRPHAIQGGVLHVWQLSVFKVSLGSFSYYRHTKVSVATFRRSASTACAYWVTTAAVSWLSMPTVSRHLVTQTSSLTSRGSMLRAGPLAFPASSPTMRSRWDCSSTHRSDTSTSCLLRSMRKRIPGGSEIIVLWAYIC